jgi:hypothetical protein
VKSKERKQYAVMLREDPSLEQEWVYRGLFTPREIIEIQDHRSLIVKARRKAESILVSLPERWWIIPLAIMGLFFLAIVVNGVVHAFSVDYTRLQDVYHR